VIGLETTGFDTESSRFIELKTFPVKALNNFCFEVIRSPILRRNRAKCLKTIHRIPLKPYSTTGACWE